MKHLNAVIIEDDESQLSELELLLEQHHPEIKLQGNAGNVADAVKLVNKVKPDLVFLDIDLPGGDGFDVIKKTNVNHFRVIFTTAHQNYAVRAFEFSALHYLLKPIAPDKLKEAINRYPEEPDNDFDKKLQILKDSLQDRPQKIMLPTGDGIILVNIADIVRFEANRGYALVFFNDGRRNMLISRTLNEMYNLLADMDFARPHHSHLVNLKYIEKYRTRGNGSVLMKDGVEISISQTYRSSFRNAIENFARA